MVMLRLDYCSLDKVTHGADKEITYHKLENLFWIP